MLRKGRVVKSALIFFTFSFAIVSCGSRGDLAKVEIQGTGDFGSNNSRSTSSPATDSTNSDTTANNMISELEEQHSVIKASNNGIELSINTYQQVQQSARDVLKTAVDGNIAKIDEAVVKIEEILNGLDIENGDPSPYLFYQGAVAGRSKRSIYFDAGLEFGRDSALNASISRVPINFENQSPAFIEGYQAVGYGDFVKGKMAGYVEITPVQTSDNSVVDVPFDPCPTVKYGTLFQCGANICAKSDAGFQNSCVALAETQLSSYSAAAYTACPNTFYGSVFECGNGLCSKSDSQFLNMCSLTGSL